MAKSEDTTTAPEGKIEICKDRSGYVSARTSSGKMSKRSDDLVARCFEGLTIEQKYNIASTLLGVDGAELLEKYKHLNVGLQGMSLANRCRPVVKKDELKAAKLEKLVAPIQKAREQAAAKAAKAKELDAAAKAKAKEAKEQAAAKATA